MPISLRGWSVVNTFWLLSQSYTSQEPLFYWREMDQIDSSDSFMCSVNKRSILFPNQILVTVSAGHLPPPVFTLHCLVHRYLWLRLRIIGGDWCATHNELFVSIINLIVGIVRSFIYAWYSSWRWRVQALDELIGGGQKASELRCFCPESLTRPVTLFLDGWMDGRSKIVRDVEERLLGGNREIRDLRSLPFQNKYGHWTTAWTVKWEYLSLWRGDLIGLWRADNMEWQTNRRATGST